MVTRLLVAVLLLLALPAGAIAEERGQIVDSAWTVPTVAKFYETPCELRERVARGIPVFSVDYSRGYMAWYRANWDTPAWHAWNAAAAACRRDHPVPRWAHDQMIMTNSEIME
jgi:hypothetical protein